MGVSAQWMDRESRNGHFQYQTNYKHAMVDNVPQLRRDEIRITGIQIYLLLNGDEYGLDPYDIAMVVWGGIGLVLILRNLMLLLIYFCSSDGNRWYTFKYAGIVHDENR